MNNSTCCRSAALAIVLMAEVLGCSSERPKAMPSSAKPVALQGRNEAVIFTAPERGVAYLYDRSTHNMVYTGWLKGGEVLELDPQRDEVRISGRVVGERDLRDLNGYEVWFDPKGPSAVQKD